MLDDLKTYVNKYFSNGPRTAAVIILILMIILVVLIFSVRNTVIISIDGKENEIVTFRSNYGDVLKNNNIVLGPKDKVEPSLDSKVQNNGRLFIKRAVKLEVQVDGHKISVDSAEDSIYDMLKAEGIKLHNLDRVFPSGKLPLKSGLKIVVTRIRIKDVKTNSILKYKTVVKNDSSMNTGERKVIQEGQNGEKETVTRIVYEDGKEKCKQIIGETIKKEPVQKIVAVGSSAVHTISRGGSFLSVKSIRMRATGYTAGYESTGKSPGDSGFGITATGTIARRGSSSSVAVDPRVIPLGTKLYVEGYGYAIAEDTGGAIKGARVDLFFNSVSEANNWGVKWVNVYVIE